MTDQNYIEFKQERGLGEILNDTFAFVRQNYKALFKAIFKLVGPILILLILALSGYFYLISNSLSNTIQLSQGGGTPNFGSGWAIMGTMLLMMLVFLLSVLYYSFFYSTINFCVKSYIDNKGTIVYEEVKSNVKIDWGKFLGLSFLIILIFIGAFLVGFIPTTVLGIIIGSTVGSVGLTFFILFLGYIPLIYLYVPMTIVFAIVIFKNMSTGSAIGYSFKLVKSHWWKSFLTLFVMGVVFVLIGLIFQFPVLLYTLIKALTMGKEITIDSFTDFNAFFDWGYILLTAVGYIGRFLFYGLMVVCGTFIFFNLNEKKNQTGTLEAIESLGNNQSEEKNNDTFDENL